MRKILIALLPLLLAGCVDDTASYRTNGGSLSITVHRAQEHLWSSDVTVEVVVAREPDCQRRVELGVIPADDVEFELLSPGDDQWYLRAGQQLWQFETTNCTQYEEAKGQPGQLLGVYKVDNGKLLFEAAKQAAAPAQASVPTPTQAAEAQAQEQ